MVRNNEFVVPVSPLCRPDAAVEIEPLRELPEAPQLRVGDVAFGRVRLGDGEVSREEVETRSGRLEVVHDGPYRVPELVMVTV